MGDKIVDGWNNSSVTMFFVLMGILGLCVLLSQGCSNRQNQDELLQDSIHRAYQASRDVDTEGPEWRLVLPDPDWEDQR